MLNWFRRPRLSASARRKLLIVAARSEEAIVETHVSNALDLLDALGDEVDLDHGLELYREMVPIGDTIASVVMNRILARLEALPEQGGKGSRSSRFRDVFREGHGDR
jgi:hypothetical protein